LKASDFLTINEENRLRKTIDELSESSKASEYIINGKLVEKEEEINLLQQNIEMNSEAITILSDRIAELNSEVRTLKQGVNKLSQS
jgi:hypothetical protein